MRIRFNFARKIDLAYLSHLDMLRLFLRALNRSGLPLAYSQGFNPHPRFILALPLPLGITAEDEYAEVFFTEEVNPDHFLRLLGAQLPEALVLKSASAVETEAPTLASLVGAALYTAVPVSGAMTADEAGLIQVAVDALMGKNEILMRRKTKKKKTTVTNIRPYILEAGVKNSANHQFELNLLLQAGSQGGVSPVYVIEQLEPVGGCGRIQANDWQIHRKQLYMKYNDLLQPLSEGR